MMDNEYITIIFTIMGSTLASSGFWAYITTKSNDNTAQNNMLLGLAHDKIMELAMKYISRGYVTYTEYENLDKYLYTPYKELKGNGTVDRLMSEVRTLPISRHMDIGEKVKQYENEI